MKAFLSIIFVFFVGIFFAQNANVSYEVRLNSVYSTDGSSISGSSCWESSNEEYSANLRVDGPTTGTNFCLQDGGAGSSSTYGGGTILRTLSNVATSSYQLYFDIYEDDGGSRCAFNSGDDCRALGSYAIPFVDNYFPSANATYNNLTDNLVYNAGSSQHNVRLGTSWRYSGNASLITPSCAVQTAAYVSGSIRSWSVNLTAGVTYNFNNCTSASSDTYLRIYNSDGYTIIATGDDNCGALSSINYTPTVSGTYYVELSNYSRSALTLSGTLTYSIVPKVGSTISNPLSFGTLSCGTNYSNTQNNTVNTGFCNDYGQASDDIYYSFVLTSPATVNISHCGSGLDTYLHLLNSSGVLLNSNDDNGILCTGSAASLQVGLASGTYYVVSEGFSTNSGNISTSVSIAAANNPGTISAPAAICIGSSASISNVAAATGVTSTDVASYYYYYQRTSAPTTGWVMYDGPSYATTSSLPIEVTGTAGTYLLARNSAFPCYSQVSAAFLNFTVDAQPTLGTVSTGSTIDFCDAGGNFGTAVNVSGQIGSIIWDWGSNNGTWNNNWVAGSNSGICCFPIKTSNSDGNADRIRYRVSSGACPVVTSNTILIKNRYNPAPTSLTSSASVFCNNSIPATITLTAVFPENINMNGVVRFYSGSCSFIGVGSIVSSATSSTASLTITAPTITTTYYAKFDPGIFPTCTNSACVQTTVIVNTLSVAPNSISGNTTICSGSSTALTVSGGSVGSGANAKWYTGSCGGTLVGTGNSISVSPSTTTTYFVRYEGTCNTTTCAAVTVIVNALAIAPISISGNTTICVDGATLLTLVGGSPGTSFFSNVSWYTESCGGTSCGSGNSILVSPAVNTTYYVRYETSCNFTSCAEILVNVVESSIAPSSITMNSNICPGSELTLTQVGGTLTTGAEYEWFSGSCDGVFLGNGNSITLNPTNSSNYFVRVAANGECPATTCAFGTVSLPFLTSSISGNGESATCYVSGTNFIHFYHSTGRLIGSINPNGNNLGNVTMVSYVDGSPQLVLDCASSNLTFATSVMQRHWVISPTIQPISNVTVKLPYNNSELSNLMVVANGNSNPTDNLASSGDLKLSKYSGPMNVNALASDNCAFPVSTGSGNTSLHFQSGSGNVSTGNSFLNNINNANYLQFDVSGFSEFWLNGKEVATPLPIELKYFTANCSNNTTINWTTSSETNTQKFIVEKSRDLEIWEYVGEQMAAGNSSIELDYELNDFNSWNGISYYRMRQVDLNGLEKTFGPINVDCEGLMKDEMIAFPNPTKTQFTVQISVNETVAGKLQILDLTGKLIISNETTLKNGVNQFKFYDEQFKKGTYFIHFENQKVKIKPIKIVVIE
jgi:hypothetical protein